MNDQDDSQKLSFAKDVEFYSQAVSGWFNTRLEHDKSLLTLSVAGLGMLVGFISTGIGSITSLILYIGAIVSFLICLFSVLIIFQKNSTHIQDVLNGAKETNKVLEILDIVAKVSFYIGVLFSSIIGISLAIQNFMKGCL